MTRNVVVLDGNQRASLAVTRSLGRRGIKVSVGETGEDSLASRSRYCASRFAYPDPVTAPASFFERVAETTSDQDGILLIPITDVTVSEILKNRDGLGKNVILPFADFQAYHRASDKVALFRKAEEIGLPIPETVFFQGGDAVPVRGVLPGFPVVVKPSFSKVFTEGRWVETTVRYAGNNTELDAILRSIGDSSISFLIQERIQGPGVGIFLLMQKGKVLARFAHRRIREKPPSGGVSVLCEGIEPPDDALDAATRLLQNMDWTGVAMVEFKQDKRDGIHKLIEVNARFWGSLQLAISSGVDFPYLLYRLAFGETATGPEQYRRGLRIRWELGDLDHLMIRLAKKKAALSLPEDAPSRREVLFDFFADFFRPSVKHEVLKSDDPDPFLFELKQYLLQLVEKQVN